MSDQIGGQEQSVVDVLAWRLEAGRGAASRWAGALRELGAIDRAVYQAVADTPSPELDGAFRRFSTAANQSRLWLGIAAAMALLGGSRGRRAASEGLLAIGTTSAVVNLGIKLLARRPRRGGPLARSHRRPLPERRGDRLHYWSRNRRNGDSFVRYVARAAVRSRRTRRQS